ncbi:MAG: hypothetical protein ACI9MC_002965, partial [Kiritimatiellia bacterium]
AINTAPSITSASISPASPKEGATLTCTPSGWSDIDLDKAGYRYQWLRNGKVIDGQTTSTLTSGYFSKGQKIQCRITPWDGEANGTRRDSNTVSIGNSAPSIDKVVIAKTSPMEADTISVAIYGVSDPDGDKVSFKYAWYVNKTLVSTGSTINGKSFNKNQDIYVVVTPTDGSLNGAAKTSNVVRSINTVPVISSVTISPNPAYKTTSLTAVSKATDADSDKLSYTHVWTINGKAQRTTGSVLDKSLFKKKDSILVTVTVHDGEAKASLRNARPRVISNSAPSGTARPTMGPASPSVSSNLSCTTSGASDADKDTLTYYYQYYRNGSLYGTYTSTAKSYSLSSSNTGSGQSWYCRVRARDTDSAYGGWSSNSNTVSIKSSTQTYWINSWAGANTSGCGGYRYPYTYGYGTQSISWRDRGGSRPTKVTVTLGYAISCNAGSYRSSKLNGTNAGSFRQSRGSCYCDARYRGTIAYNLSGLSAYKVGGTNTLSMTGGYYEGLYKWSGGNYARVVVQY